MRVWHRFRIPDSHPRYLLYLRSHIYPLSLQHYNIFPIITVEVPLTFCAWNVPASQLRAVRCALEWRVGCRADQITIKAIAPKPGGTNNNVALGFLDLTLRVNHPPTVRFQKLSMEF